MLPADRFFEFIHDHQLFNSEDRILLTVSGGRDSVLMTYLFNEASLHFGIAHCNFGLRGAESDEDENFVRELANRFSVPYHRTKFETVKFAETRNISIQMAARELRYQWFEEIRAQHGYRYIAVAHHQSDATETVLLNLVRGTGIAGLHGILPKRGYVIRPLLFLSREEVDELVSENGISYREDSSNLSSKYARNKIRLDVIPVLKKLNHHLDSTFAANSRRFAETEEFLTEHAAVLRETIFKMNPDGSFSAPLEELKRLKPLRLLMFEIFKPWNFSEPVLEDLISAWNSHPGKQFASATHKLLVDRDRVILKPGGTAPATETAIDEKAGKAEWRNYNFSSFYADPSNVTFLPDPKIAYFDAGLLQFPLKIRLWNKGDYFYPFGMKGRKKLSDFFTSLKLSLFEKENVPVLENGNGDILWIAGYRADNRYKVSHHTKKVFILEINNNHEQ